MPPLTRTRPDHEPVSDKVGHRGTPWVSRYIVVTRTGIRRCVGNDFALCVATSARRPGNATQQQLRYVSFVAQRNGQRNAGLGSSAGQRAP